VDRLIVGVANGNPVPLGGFALISGNATILAAPPNQAPLLATIADPTAILEDADLQSVNLTGIAAGTGEMQALTITVVSSNPGLIPNPSVSYTSPGSAAALSYKPVANRSGTSLITVTIKDNGGTLSGGVDTVTKTFSVNVTPINDPPTFNIGGDQNATDEDSAQSIANWATAISPGSDDETLQKLNFSLDIDNLTLFAVPPAIDGAGKLTYTPAPNAHGKAHVAVQLHDDGGTANGGVDVSGPQAFDITITKPHPWHNRLHALDVTGPAGHADEVVAAGDALAIINYINAFGPGHIPLDAAPGAPYLDTAGGPGNGGDDFVSAGDALEVINFINAFGSGLSGPEGEGESVASQSLANISAEQPVGSDLLALLAFDIAMQSKRRRL
jgi:hypothetical protein